MSKLANHYPERVIAYAFISVPYVPPALNTNFQHRLDWMREKFGYELYGYWYFFAEGDIDGAFRRHVSRTSLKQSSRIIDAKH